VLDALVSGGFVISDGILGMDDLLDGSVPVYHCAEELRALLDLYIGDEAGREKLAIIGREIASQYTYASCCSEIIRHISSISGKLFS
jgi:spore maturation protein CgeB